MQHLVMVPPFLSHLCVNVHMSWCVAKQAQLPLIARSSGTSPTLGMADIRGLDAVINCDRALHYLAAVGG
jgi:hypothetical protein